MTIRTLAGLLLLCLFVFGCGSSNDETKITQQILGVWRVDLASSKVPAVTPEDQAEESSMRLTINADGTYQMAGVKQPDHGKWKLQDGTILFRSDIGAAGLPSLTPSPDGSRLSAHDIIMNFVKATV